MTTIKEGLHYVRLPNGEYVSAGKARSNQTKAATGSQPLAPIRSELQHAIPQTLDSHAPKQARRSKSPRLCHVLFVRCGARLLDDDNLAASYKALRDRIAAKLGIDDGDPRIKFDYEQVVTKGVTGTHVLISKAVGV